MGLERGGFILMISHYGRVAILGCIEIHYYIKFFFFSFSFCVCARPLQSRKQTNKTKQREKGGKKERNRNRTGKNVIFKGAAH